MHTKAFVFAAGLGLLSPQAVLAADLPSQWYHPSAPPPVVYSWSGCYIGLHGGWGWGRTEFADTVNTTAFGDLAPGDNLTTDTQSGFVGGGQGGCNYQLSYFVLGAEASFAGSSIKGDFRNAQIGNVLVGAPDDVYTTKITSIAMVTGRVGLAFNDLLLYTKGGYAGANMQFSVVDTTGPNQGSGSDTTWRNGWTAGLGLEYMITPNWIIGAEYDYINLGTARYEVGGGLGSYTLDVRNHIHQVLGRVSFKFGP